MSVSIHHQIAEAELWVRELSTGAGKPGKGQELARYRHEAAQGILATLEFCRQHEAGIRQFMATKRSNG